MSQAAKPKQPLKLRSRLVSSHQINVTNDTIDAFSTQLDTAIAQAPALFKSAPSILDISECPADFSDQLLQDRINVCREKGLVPFALTSTSTEHQALANTAGFAWVEAKATRKTSSPKETQPAIVQTKVISTPIRSGQQVYAKDANLLITSQVSAGAEVIADGNIHIMGALRGRAIAGAQGLTSSEIVCQVMQAELIAIAGNYLVQDDFPKGDGGARCYLDEQKLNIDYI
ncbi:septum site-determining protein MinC [Reinekea sp.]|jgi:septum site-determining protein MinC|uniref:septum site-determining protein MinC n=1 Tax=Reinekea sp. TaxID=1970455 RepID=UPI003989ADA5